MPAMNLHARAAFCFALLAATSAAKKKAVPASEGHDSERSSQNPYVPVRHDSGETEETERHVRALERRRLSGRTVTVDGVIIAPPRRIITSANKRGKLIVTKPAPPVHGYTSQIAQDRCLIEHVFRYKTRGFYIDMAANDARHLSNTYLLDRNLSWSGLCVEANRHYLPGLTDQRTCDIARVVVSNVTARSRFRFHGENGGLVIPWMEGKDGIQEVETMGIRDLLKTAGSVPRYVDYMSLDLEGAEESVMRSFPFDAFSIDVLTIERPPAALHTQLVELGYCVKVCFDTHIGDIMYVKRSSPLSRRITTECRRRPLNPETRLYITARHWCKHQDII